MVFLCLGLTQLIKRVGGHVHSTACGHEGIIVVLKEQEDMFDQKGRSGFLLPHQQAVRLHQVRHPRYGQMFQLVQIQNIRGGIIAL